MGNNSDKYFRHLEKSINSLKKTYFKGAQIKEIDMQRVITWFDKYKKTLEK